MEVSVSKLKALISFNNYAVDKGKYGRSVKLTNTARLDQTTYAYMHCVYVIIKSSGMRNVFALAVAFWCY